MKALAVALAVLLSSFAAAAQTTGNLNKTVFWSQKAIAVQASCQTYDCLAYATLFCSVDAPNCANTDPTELKIICPGPAGSSCVFHIGVEASMFLGNEVTLTEVTGLYHFLIDGAPPNPGPAPNSNGFVEWGCVGNGDIGAGCRMNCEVAKVIPSSDLATAIPTTVNPPDAIMVVRILDTQEVKPAQS